MEKDREVHMEEFRKECPSECVALAKVSSYNKFITALLITLLGANGFVLLKYADTSARIANIESNTAVADKMLNERANAQREEINFLRDKIQRHELEDAQRFHKIGGR